MIETLLGAAASFLSKLILGFIQQEEQRSDEQALGAQKVATADERAIADKEAKYAQIATDAGGAGVGDAADRLQHGQF